MSVDRSTLVDAFSESVGRKRAEELVSETAADLGVDFDGGVTEEDAIAIMEALSDNDDTFVRVSATTVKTQLLSGGLS